MLTISIRPYELTISERSFPPEQQPNQSQTPTKSIMSLLLLRTPSHANALLASPRPAPAPAWPQANFEDLKNPEQSQHIRETGDSVELSLDVPGVKAQDLKVQVEDGVLRVSGERKTAGCQSKFDRSFAVDSNAVNISAVKANLDAGVLTLTVPKREKAAPKSIAITEEPAKEVLMVTDTTEEEATSEEK
jgi:HSP20 family molecular chaperone IbpA